MLLKMTDEPDDYEGPWPTEDAMSEWKLVPVEATEEMIRAGYCAPTVFGVRDMGNIYRAMLDAAPAAQQAEPVGEVRSETCHYSMMPDRICNKCGRVHGFSHPPLVRLWVAGMMG